MHGVLFAALAVGIFGVLPRLGGLTHEAAGLRHARPVFLVAAVVAQAVSLGCYALLYRQVLAALGARVRFRLAADVVLASFFVSHLTPFGSAAGTLVNVNTLEAEGVEAATTGEAIGLTSLLSTVALIALFGIGFVATAGGTSPTPTLRSPASHSSSSWRCSPPCSLSAPTPRSPAGPGAGRRAWPGTSVPASIPTRWPRRAAGSPGWPAPR